MLFDADAIGLRPALGELDDPDLHQFITQARDLESQFREKWDRLADVFLILALLGEDWEKARRDGTEGDMLDIGGFVGTEATSPLDHLVDEYGRAMANIMVLVDDHSSSLALRQAWNGVLHDLANEVRMRQFKRLNEDPPRT